MPINEGRRSWFWRKIGFWFVPVRAETLGPEEWAKVRRMSLTGKRRTRRLLFWLLWLPHNPSNIVSHEVLSSPAQGSRRTTRRLIAISHASTGFGRSGSGSHRFFSGRCGMDSSDG